MRHNKKNIINISISIIPMAIFLFFAYPAVSLGAEVTLQTNKTILGAGSLVSLDLIFDPANDSINALEGTLLLPEDYISNPKISTGDSLISEWIDTPEVSSNQIHFSGIVPGGFSGLIDPRTNTKSPGVIFHLEFTVPKTGSFVLSLTDFAAYKNDGLGTQVLVSSKPLPFIINTESPTLYGLAGDTTPPEPFTIYVSKDPNIFDGKYFITFQAIDNGSGIQSYKVKEDGQPWYDAMSPYVLLDQSLRGQIKVVATDRAGNERVAVYGKNYTSIFSLSFGVISGLLLMVILYFYLRRKAHQVDRFRTK